MKLIKYQIFFILLALLTTYNELYSQLDESYITNYIANYDQNVPHNVRISPKTSAYGYSFDNSSINIHNKKGYINIKCEFNYFIYEDYVFYEESKKLYRLDVSKIPERKNIILGDIENKIHLKDLDIFILKDSQVYIFQREKFSNYNKVKKILKTENNYLYYPIITLSNNKSIFLSGRDILEIEDLIIDNIYGITDNLLISEKYLYIYNTLNNKITKINNIISKQIDSLRELKSQLNFINNKIIITEVKDTLLIKDYYLSDSLLDINYFLELSTNDKRRIITDTKILDIRTGKIKVNNKNISRKSTSYLTYGSRSAGINPLIQIFTKIRFENGTLEPGQQIYNIVYDDTIFPAKIVKGLSTYEITPDARFMYLSDKNKNLFRYDFLNKETQLIYKKFPFRQNNLEYKENVEEIEIYYDFLEKKTFINSNRLPFMIDSIGMIDSLKITTNSKNDLTILYKYWDKRNYLIYSMNEENGTSEIIYLNDKIENKLSSNDSYKLPQSSLYYPNIDTARGILAIGKDYILWSESNLKNGSELFVYTHKDKTKRKLEIIFSKKYDSLDYKYFSYNTGDALIRGGIKFPKGYEKNKKYPVILSIYLNKMNLFHFPSRMSNIYYELNNLSSNALLNEINLLHQGYAICYIDVPFSNGIYSSHSYYINNIIKNVFPKINSIDINNIAILGHSRTAGQSLGALINDSIIKCGIISNGILSELLDASQFSDYSHTSDLSKHTRQSRFSRKFSTTFNSTFDILEELKDNYSRIISIDPLFKLDKINSSILFLLNDNDGSISSNNGYFTYIKTKLLEKNTYLLNFHEEGHNITKPELQKIAYNIMIDYLNFYLKENNSSKTKWNYNQTK